MATATKISPQKPRKAKKPLWLHHLFWRVGRLLVPLILRRYRFRAVKLDLPKEPCLVFCNHLTKLDPFLLGTPFPRLMYYVASEHLMRTPYAWLIRLFADPILRHKTRTEANTVLEILRRLKAGHNVCLFIEGERSYGGTTEPIADSAAHLVRMAKVPLVTYRLEEGYFIEPRWCAEPRRGDHFHGRLAHIYSVEEISQMSDEQLLQRLRADLYVDAYQEQEPQPRAYPGARLAEYLETVLYRCPSCGAIGSLHSAGDRFSCSCGMILRYTEQGYFQPLSGDREAPFTTIRDWYRWQQASLPELLARHAQETPQLPLSRDRNQVLRCCDESSHRVLWQKQGDLYLFREQLQFHCAEEQLSFALDKVSNISCQDRQILSFGFGGQLYEVLSDAPRSAIKYSHFFHALRQA